MTVYIVTIKLDKMSNHNPDSKITGICRHGKSQCTDITGEHHSFLHIEDDYGNDTVNVQRQFEKKGFHVTRVETA